MDRAFVEPFMSPMVPLPTGLSPVGSLHSKIHCLLCDIYGTLFISGSGDISLVQTEAEQQDNIEKLLIQYQIDMSPAKLIEALHDAIGAAHQKAKAEGVTYPEVQIEKIWADLLPLKPWDVVRSFAVAFEMTMNPVWPMPGLNALLQSCRKNGVLLGIISNAQFYTPHLFEWFLGKDLHSLGFQPRLTFFSYEYGLAKPSKHLFRLAAENLESFGITPKHVAYIGNDRRNDVAPARSIGFQTVLFAGDARSLRMRENDPTCVDADPDLQITHLDQLTSCLC